MDSNQRDNLNIDFSQLKEFIQIIDKSSFKHLSMDYENISISLSKSGESLIENKKALCEEGSGINDLVLGSIISAKSEQQKQSFVRDKEDKIKINSNANEKIGNLVKSPLVGTFYDSPSPNESSFVKVGSKVKKGDLLAIVEAMKVMNEITSEFDGEIAEICAVNEDLVEYNQPLFRII